MKIVQPEERVLADERWAKELFTEVSPPEQLLKNPATTGDIDTEALERLLAQQVSEGWELIRESAEAALAKNPDDEEAQFQLLGYQQWERRKDLPPERQQRLIVSAHPKSKTIVASDRLGVWVRGSDGGWYISIGRSELGDKVKVKKVGGVIEQFVLTERVAHNIYKGKRI